MSSNKVIVFGPTGGVGSFTALAAQERGAKVYLGMRDTQKAIPGLDPAREQQGGFERVQADLTKPDTVKAAVAQTGAKRAFVYLAFGTPDHMRATLEALKSAGVEFVVFLSSFSVEGDRRAVPPGEFVAWEHAQVEIALEEVFGAGGFGFAAVRPAFFATNVVRWFGGLFAAGEGKLLYPEARFDYITPEDIGRVCGSLLTNGPRALDDDGEAIDLCGPQLLSLEEAVGIIGKAIGKDLRFEAVTEDEEALKFFVDNGLPEPVAKNLVKSFGEVADGRGAVEKTRYEKAVANIQKYGGEAPTKFQDWVEANKARFTA
ncbi:hypothetical protein VTK56DRAFT_1239 [Thermocarpiscus australiensis]